ncbi:MAG: DUF4349 domain-containing protein [Lachnospiraceae bacterium]|nr:DUF4349 domain-containing protein [Lachnospiraceae bacterium]
MKKRELKRNLGKLLAGVIVLTLLAGCGGASKSSDANYKAANNSGASYKSESAAYDAGYRDDADMGFSDGIEVATNGKSGNESLSNTSASKRKLIKNVSMSVETQEYETLMTNLETRVKELGGYIQNLESYNGSNYNDNYNYKSGTFAKRNASIVIRIPQQKLDDFVSTVSELSNVINRRESVEDVTLQYVDVKSHKESLQVEQARLLELLERAENLEDIITLENRLTSVRYQIESMESTLRTYDDLVDYSTVNLQITEVEVYTPVEEKKETNWERMTNGFVESLIDVRDGFIDFGIWFVVHIPYLIIWAVVITVILMIIKKLRKKSSGKKEKMPVKGQEPELSDSASSKDEVNK